MKLSCVLGKEYSARKTIFRAALRKIGKATSKGNFYKQKKPLGGYSTLVSCCRRKCRSRKFINKILCKVSDIQFSTSISECKKNFNFATVIMYCNAFPINLSYYKENGGRTIPGVLKIFETRPPFIVQTKLAPP